MSEIIHSVAHASSSSSAPSASSSMEDDTEKAEKAAKAISSMQHKREHLGSLQPYCDIYSVPEQLSKLNPNAYAPQSVSIGPLHYHKDRNSPTTEARESSGPLPCHESHKFPITEARKFHYLNRLLIGHSKEYSQAFIRNVIAKDGWVERARKCYPDTTCLENEEFIEMMVLDGCFILGYLYVMDRAIKDLFVSNTSWQAEIMADMIKLENQLPLFVLRDLYAKVFPSGTPFSSFIYINLIRLLARSVSPKLFAGDYMPKTLPAVSTGEADNGAKHFLDFLRRLIIQPEEGPTPVSQPASQPEGEEESIGICLGVEFGNLACWTTRSYEGHDGSRSEKFVRLRYSASQLKTAGVKFQQKDKATSILDIDFDEEEGELSIPPICILNNTELVLRNLMVFEQEKPIRERLMSAYAAFLDDLIDTVDDVKLLTEKGIIMDNLGNPEYVAALFNNITRNVSILNTHFSGVINDLEGYYNKGCNRFMADLKQNYFGSPWSLASFLAAAFVIILTVIQTVYSMLPSKK